MIVSILCHRRPQHQSKYRNRCEELEDIRCLFLLNDCRQVRLLFSRLMTELDFSVDTKLELSDEYQESFRFLLMFRSKFLQCFRITAVNPISESHQSPFASDEEGIRLTSAPPSPRPVLLQTHPSLFSLQRDPSPN